MALAIDGTNNNNAVTNTTVAAALTTASANDYIIAVVRYQSATLSSVSGGTLGSFGQIADRNSGGNNVAIWAKFSSGAITSETITAVQSANDDISIDVFGVSGSNQTSLVFDSGGPVTAGGSPQNFTTANANTMLISAMDWFIVNPGPGSGFTQLPGSGVAALLTQYQVLSSAGLVAVGSGNDGLVNAFAAIAIVQAAAGGDTLMSQTCMLSRDDRPDLRRTLTGWRRRQSGLLTPKWVM